MYQFNVGITALNLSQFAVSSTSNNIANANTPGFHRRQVLMVSLAEFQNRGRLVGGGVGLGDYRQVRNRILESDLSRAIGDLSGVEEQLRIDNRVESLLGSGSGSLSELLARFESSIRQFSTNPADPTQRRLVLDNAVQLTSQVRDAASGLRELQTELRRQINVEVDSLNGKLEELADIQQRLYVSRENSTSAELVDRRDQLINELAEVIDVNRNESSGGGFGLSLGSGTLTVGQVPMNVRARSEADGSISLSVDEFGIPLRPSGGRLGALLQSHNTVLGEFQNRLNSVTRGLVQNFDQAHATGIGSAGSFDRLVSQRRISNVSLPLAQAGLQLPATAGDLFLTVTDPAGGMRTTRIAFDPQTDSLTDLATSISGVQGLSASVSPSNGTLSIRSSQGYRFDFTGRPDSAPDHSSFTGTARASLSGSYTGTANDQLRIEIVGSGQVGLTDGLKAQVFSSSGELLNEIDLGSKYEAGTRVDVGQGIQIAFAAGTANAGDRIQPHLVANPDTGGLLSALGLNSFFTGNSADNVGVSQNLRDNPQLIANGISGDSADTVNLQRLLQSFLKPVENDQDVASALTSIAVAAGSRVQTGNALESQLRTLKNRVESDRDTFSGVDLNEELVNMTRYQKAFEAALRVLQSVDNMYDETLRMLS